MQGGWQPGQAPKRPAASGFEKLDLDDVLGESSAPSNKNPAGSRRPPTSSPDAAAAGSGSQPQGDALDFLKFAPKAKVVGMSPKSII